MTDDKESSGKNQLGPTPKSTPLDDQKPRVIFETVEERHEKKSGESLKPEEISATSTTPFKVEEAKVAPPPKLPDLPKDPPGTPPPRNPFQKHLMIAVGAVVFVVIFILIFWGIFSRFGAKKEIKLTYWGLWNDASVLNPLIKEYESKHSNIKIEYLRLSPQDYREKVINRSQNERGPDIFRFHNTWLAQLKDTVAPLPSSIMSNSDFEKTFYPIHQKDLKVGKFYYGLPLSIDGLVLVYNQDLFKKAGIENAPVSWEDVIEDASKLTVKSEDGTIITSGIALGTATNVDHFSDIFGLFLVQNGGDLKKLDQPEATGALEGYRKFAEPPDNVWDESLPPSILAFSQEKVAMIIIPSWQLQTIKNLNPQINLKVTVIPNIPGASPVSLASYWIEGVSRYSKNQGEAWKFVKFLTEKETMTKVYELQAKTRAFGEPYSRVDLGSTLSQNPFVGPVIKQANSYVSLPVVSRTFDNGLNDEIILYLQNAINATAEGVSYEEALATAKEGIDQVFKKYGIE